MRLKSILPGLVLMLIYMTASSQERAVGGPCQDCEALLDYQDLGVQLQSSVTLPGFKDNEPKIKITGTVFQKDGKTPASNVILYIYHVDRNGVYQPSSDPKGYERWHGQYRGWIKTGADGQYSFYSFRPASYPQRPEPEHIHIYVKEPNTIPYYIDSILFESDPLLTEDKKKGQQNRGGSGIVRLQLENGIWTAQKDIMLGLNIPDYD